VKDRIPVLAAGLVSAIFSVPPFAQLKQLSQQLAVMLILIVGQVGWNGDDCGEFGYAGERQSWFRIGWRRSASLLLRLGEVVGAL
jgi:hypothetical protein